MSVICAQHGQTKARWAFRLCPGIWIPTPWGLAGGRIYCVSIPLFPQEINLATGNRATTVVGSSLVKKHLWENRSTVVRSCPQHPRQHQGSFRGSQWGIHPPDLVPLRQASRNLAQSFQNWSCNCSVGDPRWTWDVKLHVLRVPAEKRESESTKRTSPLWNALANNLDTLRWSLKPLHILFHSRILKWRYCTIFQAIFCGNIPIHPRSIFSQAADLPERSFAIASSKGWTIRVLQGPFCDAWNISASGMGHKRHSRMDGAMPQPWICSVLTCDGIAWMLTVNNNTLSKCTPLSPTSLTSGSVVQLDCSPAGQPEPAMFQWPRNKTSASKLWSPSYGVTGVTWRPSKNLSTIMHIPSFLSSHLELISKSTISKGRKVTFGGKTFNKISYLSCSTESLALCLSHLLIWDSSPSWSCRLPSQSFWGPLRRTWTSRSRYFPRYLE